MISVAREVKVWIFILLGSLLIWTANWIPSSILRIQDFATGARARGLGKKLFQE